MIYFRENGAYFSEGYVYQFENKHKKSIQSFINSMNFCNKHGLTSEIGITLYYLGETYKKTGDSKKALNFFEKAKKNFELLNDRTNLKAIQSKIDEIVKLK